MFDLEKAIADWRREMLAAGIKTPVPLEELESHLREEIERETTLGLNVRDAFNFAVEKIGQPGSLKLQFKKIGGFRGWFGDNKFTRINHILGTLWTAQCLWFSVKLLPVLGQTLPYPQNWTNPGFLLLALGVIIYLVGVSGGVCLFRGAEFGRSIIRIIAFLGMIACVAEVLQFGSLSALGIAITAFNLITIWLLHTPQKPKLATK